MDGPAEQRCHLPQVDKMAAVQQHCRAAAGFRGLQVFVDHLHTQSENIVGAVGGLRNIPKWLWCKPLLNSDSCTGSLYQRALGPLMKKLSTKIQGLCT